MCSDSGARIGSLFRELAGAVSLECWREPVYKKIYLILVCFYLLRDWFILLIPLAGDYVWGETFISYAGGFMRRGLFGELLGLGAPYVNARLLALLIVTAVFLLFLKLAYERISVVFDKLTTIIIFLTPASFLFFVKEPTAFLRKDQFINLLAFLAVISTVNFLKNRGRSIAAPTAIFLACFCVSFLIHEGTVFYFTLPAWLLGVAWSKQNRTLIWLLLMAALYGGAIWAAMRFQGEASNARAIMDYWTKFFPDLRADWVRYIGLPFSEARAEALHYLWNMPVLYSSVLGLVLALPPLAWICAAYNPFASMLRNVPPLMLLLLPLAAACPWTLPAFTIDFGREIANTCMQYIFILWALAAWLAPTKKPWLEKLLRRISADSTTRIWALAIILIYGTSWTLMPWVPRGQSFVGLAGLPEIIYTIID